MWNLPRLWNIEKNTTSGNFCRPENIICRNKAISVRPNIHYTLTWHWFNVGPTSSIGSMSTSLAHRLPLVSCSLGWSWVGPMPQTVARHCANIGLCRCGRIQPNSYNAELFLYKPWCLKGYFQFEIIINVFVRSFRFIWIPMFWPLHFQAEVHARIQGSWCNYRKSDGNFRHVWLGNLTNDDRNFRHVW